MTAVSGNEYPSSGAVIGADGSVCSSEQMID